MCQGGDMAAAGMLVESGGLGRITLSSGPMDQCSQGVRVISIEARWLEVGY